jgi:alanine dehydrogenase
VNELIVLNDQEVAELVGFDENLRLIEQAFADYNRGESYVLPVIREKIEKHNGFFGIKSGYLANQEVLGFKAGGFWADNKDKGLPNHQSAIMLFDPATGQPTAVIAANFVTQIRTAAIGAIGCKQLARPDSKVLALIGAGHQGRNQLEASLKVLPSINEVWVYDVYRSSAEKVVDDLQSSQYTIRVAETPEQACRAADVIVTATSSFKAIVMDAWIQPGTHINAIGTDTRGKQELDPQIFGRAAVFVDNLAQCCYLGECQHAVDTGIISREMIRAELGELINQSKPGRTSPDEITIFDTTGVAIQDLATAGYALQEAKKRGIGTIIKL